MRPLNSLIVFFIQDEDIQHFKHHLYAIQQGDDTYYVSNGSDSVSHNKLDLHFSGTVPMKTNIQTVNNLTYLSTIK